MLLNDLHVREMCLHTMLKVEPTPGGGYCCTGLTCNQQFQLGLCGLNLPDGCGQLDNCNALPANTACSLGTLECLPGYSDCDGDWLNGCEVDIDNDENNCGGCGVVCSNVCVLGSCQVPYEWHDSSAINIIQEEADVPVYLFSREVGFENPPFDIFYDDLSPYVLNHPTDTYTFPQSEIGNRFVFQPVGGAASVSATLLITAQPSIQYPEDGEIQSPSCGEHFTVNEPIDFVVDSLSGDDIDSFSYQLLVNDVEVITENVVVNAPSYSFSYTTPRPDGNMRAIFDIVINGKTIIDESSYIIYDPTKDGTYVASCVSLNGGGGHYSETPSVHFDLTDSVGLQVTTPGPSLSFVSSDQLHYSFTSDCLDNVINYEGRGNEIVPGSNQPFNSFTKIFPSSGIGCTAQFDVSLEA
jgi:hypothetical protein